MERKKAIAALGVVLLYIFAIGTVTAFSPQPGSADDPLVTRSYIDLVIAPLQNRVSQLEQDLLRRTAEMEALRADLARSNETIRTLEARVAAVSGQTPAAPTNPTVPTVPATPTTVFGFINGTWVNIRSGPGTNFSVITTLANNTRVEVIERGATWHRIRHNNQIAFVSASLLRIP